MEIKYLKKIQEKKAAEICQRFELQKETKSILTEEDTPVDFLKKLIQDDNYIEAVRFLAHGLPKRESIWWSYLCANQAENEIKDEEESRQKLILPLLEAIKKWVYEPNEKSRFAVKDMAEALELKTASSWAAMAVFWSGGSINPPGDPKVEPNEYLTAHAVAGAVTLAAVLYEPDKAKNKYQRFLEQGINIANGGNGEI